jgi:hypothetical protein
MSDDLAWSLAMLHELLDRIDPKPVHNPVTWYVRRSCYRGLPHYRGSTAQRRARIR